ncbi:unnamed protein product [Bubo scandiacus]
MSESVAEVPGDGSPAALGETGTSHELLQRLRELEAENSALAQANENQRETYERCLDEVANHVVQALLNQKDLREECIKLKKRVFDLERQNQALSDLFQQKLQLSAGSLPQLSLHPVPVPPDAPVSPQPGSAEQPPPPTAPRPLCPPARGDPVGAIGQPRAQPRRPPPWTPSPPSSRRKPKSWRCCASWRRRTRCWGPPRPPPAPPSPALPRGQERAPAGEAKGKAAGGLASWFGLRRSKLPALSRRGDGGRGREWAGTPAPLRREVKLAARKLEAESLNISKLMEKAEDLRKALREEHAFLQGLALEKGRPRGPPRGPGHLPVMYQEVTAETFMQQLLDRVDGKDAPYESRLDKRELCDLRHVPPDAKDPRLCRPARNGIVGHLREPPDKVPDVGLRDELPSDESLSESGTAQHFAACGSLTRTLDSGIGTFPPPDYGGVPAKSTPKPRGRPEPLPGVAAARPPASSTKVPRKARTLEREVPSAEELLVAGKHRSAPVCRPPAPPRPPRCAPRSTPAMLPGSRGASSRARTGPSPTPKPAAPPTPSSAPPGGWRGCTGPRWRPCAARRDIEGRPRRPPRRCPPALSASSSRTPSASDVGDEGSTEARSRDGGHGPPGLEHSESLSDSLYDSLSSCGSQG